MLAWLITAPAWILVSELLKLKTGDWEKGMFKAAGQPEATPNHPHRFD
jgi:hypothetical protein